MSRVLAVHDRLAPLFRDRARWSRGQKETNSFRSWVYFAQRYCAAATALEDSADIHIHPRIQLYGHAVECALKAFLISKQQPLPRGIKGHDLIRLASIAEEHGCFVSELQAIALVQVSSLFFKDLGSETKFKARYPCDQSESRENVVGSFEIIHELVTSVCKQSGA